MEQDTVTPCRAEGSRLAWPALPPDIKFNPENPPQASGKRHGALENDTRKYVRGEENLGDWRPRCVLWLVAPRLPAPLFGIFFAWCPSFCMGLAQMPSSNTLVFSFSFFKRSSSLIEEHQSALLKHQKLSEYESIKQDLALLNELDTAGDAPPSSAERRKELMLSALDAMKRGGIEKRLTTAPEASRAPSDDGSADEQGGQGMM